MGERTGLEDPVGEPVRPADGFAHQMRVRV
jgi:hypothetical protein